MNKEYKKFLHSLGLRDSTIKNYLWNIEQFYIWLGQDKISEQKLKLYFDHILKKYPRVATINLRLTIMNNYLKFLGRRHQYKLLSDIKDSPVVLSSQELNEFLAQAGKNKSIIGLRDKALLELLYSSGLKVGKIINLRRDQIDEIKKQIIFDPKNYLNIKALAWQHLQKYLNKRQDNSPWLFVNFDRSQKSMDRHLSVRSVERIIDKYADKLQPVLKINPQILRNTLAYNLKQEGAQKEHIKKALHFKTKIGADKYLQRL